MDFSTMSTNKLAREIYVGRRTLDELPYHIRAAVADAVDKLSDELEAQAKIETKDAERKATVFKKKAKKDA